MLRQMLWLHWKAARWVMLPLVLLCFGLPVAAVRLSRPSGGLFDALDVVMLFSVWAPMFPFLAAFVGVSLALTAWVWDHNSRHIYALSLPLERWEYTLLKLAAGALLVLVPALALWAGAWVGSLQPLPDSLHAYVAAFGARFLVAALLAYAVMFALAAGTVRTASLVATGLVLGVIFGTVGVEFMNGTFGLTLPTPIDLLSVALTQWPGPFNVYGGSWMLIDV